MQIKNEYDAFVKAIVLAIEAPTDEKCLQAAELAKGFAKNLSDSQIELGNLFDLTLLRITSATPYIPTRGSVFASK